MEATLAVLGYLAAALMGATLGLLGAGGSILTVPILVYLFQVPPVTATAYSLFVVGLTSLIGAFGYFRRRLIDYRAVCIFGLPSLVGVFLARRFLMPSLPEVIWRSQGVIITKELLIMALFAGLMVLASISMLRGGPEPEPSGAASGNGRWAPLAAVEGLAVGCITGFVGAGGGFLILPALVLLLRLPMKTAVGTSLLVIAIKSLLGFTGDLRVESDIDVLFLASFSLMSVLGIIIGVRLNHRVPAARLRPIFAGFILAMGLSILAREVFFGR
jgi:hypothetical protein